MAVFVQYTRFLCAWQVDMGKLPGHKALPREPGLDICSVLYAPNHRGRSRADRRAGGGSFAEKVHNSQTVYVSFLDLVTGKGYHVLRLDGRGLRAWAGCNG